MYGVESNRPKDIGRNSFKDFSDSLHNQTKNLKKSFLHLKDQSQAQTIQQQQIPNLKYHSATWDSQHMDAFLQDNNWAQSQTFSRNTMTASSKNTRSQKSMKNSNKSLNSTSKTSFFFNSIGRFKPNGETYLQRDYDNNYSQHNFIVYEKPTDHDKARQYFDQKFSEKQKNYNQDKLEFTQQPVRLQTPSQNRKQLNLTKAEQDQFKQWKQNHMELTKQFRVHKAAYQSGILSVDNPYNTESKLYSSESQRIKERINHSAQINKRFKKQVEERTQTNNNIEFFNKKYNSKYKVDHKHEHLNPLWNNKRRVETPGVQANYESQERLFGGPIEREYSIKRAQYLKNMDQRNRDYDFISLSKSHLDGFQNSYTKSSNRQTQKNQNHNQQINNNDNKVNQNE